MIRGGAFGGASSSLSQAITIAKDPCKSAKNFNVGAVLGSAVGGALTGGIHGAAPSSVAGQAATAGRAFGINAAAGAIGASAGQ